MSGKTIAGKYEIIRELGEGATGKVYLVRHVDLGVEYALKVLNPSFSSDERAVNRFKREAGVLSSFSHPGSIKLCDFGRTDDGRYYMTTDYCRGTPLSVLIARHGRFSLLDALDIMDQILAVLAVAHAGGIIHRDIKPENVMIEGNDKGQILVRILDFGIAKLREEMELKTSDTIEGASIGTPQYMSPEQAAGETNLDHRMDIYSAGVVMYELLSGKVPFHGETIIQTLLMHLTQQPPPFDPGLGIFPFIREIVLRALEKDPRERFQDAEEFRQACRLARERIAKFDQMSWTDEAVKEGRANAVYNIEKNGDQQTKILCLDDNPMILDILQHILSKEGYQVFTATDSTNIHNYLFQEKISLLISDVRMPGLEGTKVCEMLKETMKWLKILLFSNLPERELAKLSQQSKADGWISKGSKPEVWLEKISQVIKHS